MSFIPTRPHPEGLIRSGVMQLLQLFTARGGPCRLLVAVFFFFFVPGGNHDNGILLGIPEDSILIRQHSAEAITQNEAIFSKRIKYGDYVLTLRVNEPGAQFRVNVSDCRGTWSHG